MVDQLLNSCYVHAGHVSVVGKRFPERMCANSILDPNRAGGLVKDFPRLRTLKEPALFG